MKRSMNKQNGMALFVSLIFLLLLTIIGVAAMRGAGMQEKMAGNTRLKNQSFQLAEAALREGEGVVANGNPSCSSCGDNGCRGPDTTTITSSAAGSSAACDTWFTVSGNNTYYYIQLLGTSSRVASRVNASGGSATLYRITAVSDVGNARTVLESVYAR
ncbi:pilus assembly PilX family protein [Phytopseudomonas flavescens]|uniref:pilus assembly PilX family protein n=1 Tax=Phytopseudomonas flavescens TaxID=29435 RepID=UPI001FC8EE3D|nr:PilX N-terminal domain-containing pilus assembly protein [Pseudomonas flavescens]